MTDKSEASEKDPIMESIIQGIEIEAAFNGPDGKPPYAYKNMASGGRVSWFCGYDENEKLTSVFLFKDGKKEEKKIDYVSEADAFHIRSTLVAEQWMPIEPPKISLSYGKREAVEKPIKARKVKRLLDKESKKFDKSNPN